MASVFFLAFEGMVGTGALFGQKFVKVRHVHKHSLVEFAKIVIW
jgi:hypothetical protein